MTLTSGTRLGPYEIQSAIGAGGMGEVYKAKDTRLDRSVAIKVLPAEFSGDADRRTRFEREAKTIAGLNHPHICTLHDVGSTSSPQVASGETVFYLVMELLAGETLAERLQKGPLPIEQALTVATEIADALAAAHRQGVVHRDLKPGNVMLTKGGAARQSSPQAKLLDFGLSKLKAPAAAISMTALPTEAPATTVGTLVGTVPYMAPEQLEGKEADARSDIFSFGAVVYEMVAGRRAFEGESQASVIAAIIDREPPPLPALQPLTPSALNRLVIKCLRKDPDARWQSTSDLADECRWLLAALVQTEKQETSRTAKRSGLARILPWVVATACAGLALAVGWAARSPRLPPPLPERFDLSVGDLDPRGVAISPDGRNVVFSAADSEKQQLYLRRLGDFSFAPLVGTAGAADACFSPDGGAVNFAFADGLRRLDLKGLSPVPKWVDPAQGFFVNGTSIACGPDEEIVFPRYSGDAGLWRVSADKGWKPEPLKLTGDPTVRYLHPQVLPGGRALLFTVYKDGRPSIAALSLATKDLHTVLDGAFRGRYIAATGHLIYQAGGHLFGTPFDLTTLKTRGQPTNVQEQVGHNDAFASEYDVSDSGTLVYLPTTGLRLSWIDRQGARRAVALGKQAQAAARGARPVWVSVFPDGKRAILGLAKDSGRQLWVADNLDGEVTLTRLTQGNDDYYGVFTLDGQRVLFTSSGDGSGYQIYSTRVDGGTPIALTRGPSQKKASSVCRSADDEIFVYNDAPRLTHDIWQQLVGRPETARPLIQGPKNEVEAQFSRGCEWIAYASNESGAYEVYVKGYPEGPRHVVSPDGGETPIWNPGDGTELFYVRSSRVFAIRVVNGVRVEDARPLFEFSKSGARNWHVAPDGRRFLVAESPRGAGIRVVQNWVEELREKAPVQK